MKTWQKAIQYGAMALAVLICIGIVAGIARGLGHVTGYLESDQSSAIGEMRSYDVSDSVKELDIDIDSASLEFCVGDRLSVESNVDHLRVGHENGVLSVQDKSRFWSQSSGSKKVIITVPADADFEKITMNTGLGKVKVASLKAKKVDFEFGSGKVDIDNLVVTEQADFEGGAGTISIGDGSLCNVNFEMGVGALSVRGKLIGNCDIEMGVGAAVLTILGNMNDYTVRVEKGIGDIRVDGISRPDGAVIGNGSNSISLEGGIGGVKLDFENRTDF